MRKVFDNLVQISVIRFFIYFLPFTFFLRSGVLNFFFILLIFIGFLFILLNKVKIKVDRVDILLFFFFLIIIFSSFVNLKIIGYENFLKSIFLLRFFLFYLLIKTLIINNFIDLKKLYFFFLISVSLISLDVLIQYIFGKDLLGYPPFDNRFNGFFDDEAVAGSYIQKFTLLSIFFLIEKKINFFFKIILLTFFGISILMSLDRTPYLMYIVFVILIALFLDKKFFFLILLNFILFMYLMNTNELLKNRYLKTYKSFETLIENTIHNKEVATPRVIDKKQILLENYFNIFITSFEISKKNFLIGSGHKSFRILCPEVDIDIGKYQKTCSLHPHNLYLEILSTAGFISLIAFVALMFHIFLSLFFYSKNVNYKIILLIITAVELFPFRPNGSIFSSFNGTMFWLFLSIVFSQLTLIKKK